MPTRMRLTFDKKDTGIDFGEYLNNQECTPVEAIQMALANAWDDNKKYCDGKNVQNAIWLRNYEIYLKLAMQAKADGNAADEQGNKIKAYAIEGMLMLHDGRDDLNKLRAKMNLPAK